MSSVEGEIVLFKPLKRTRRVGEKHVFSFTHTVFILKYAILYWLVFQKSLWAKFTQSIRCFALHT